MPTNNATDTSNPVAISQGGSNASSMTTTDGVIYYDGTKLSTTGVGTAGQVLTSNGAGVAPTFQSAGAGSGGIVLLSTLNASNSSSIDFIGVMSSTYKNYQIFFNNVVPVTNNAVLHLLYGSGASFSATGYIAGCRYAASNSNAFSVNTDALQRFIPLTNTVSNAAGQGTSGYINLYNVGSGLVPTCSGLSTWSGFTGWFAEGPSHTSINSIRFIFSSGNISTGTFSIYGVFA
jgi:hypothetical protein